MTGISVTAWIMRTCVSLRRSQAKTLSLIALAALEVARASIAELGKTLSERTNVATKHAVKRVDRFLGNTRIEPITAMGDIVGWFARPGKRLLVSLDWVDVRNMHVIVLAARLGGRAVPLMWAAYRQESLFRSQNNLEYGLLNAFRRYVPKSTHVVILADRGFGRAEMARECQRLGFDYLIRIDPDVWICHKDFTGKLLDLPVRKGYRKVFRDCLYRKSHPVGQHVCVIWVEDQDEPWFLMTNLQKIPAVKLTRIYGHRMSIEEYFRDQKSKRNGFALRLTLIKDPHRLERMLLVLALAYILLIAVGLEASKNHAPREWCSNNRTTECSLFTIGRRMLDKVPLAVAKLLNQLRSQLLLQNWG